LGVKKDDSLDSIKKAYHKLVLIWDPEKIKQKEKSESKKNEKKE
jgi:DnaJ-class molecular chaperone